MRNLSKQYWDDYRWANENMTELTREHPNKWVAIVNKKVVAIGEDIKSASLKARKKSGLKEIPILFIERGIRVYKS